MRIKAAGLSPNIDKQRERDILDVYSKHEVDAGNQGLSVRPTISSDFDKNEHKLYEQYGLEPKSITQMYDVVRASTATYVDATGKIRTAGVNEPRIDYSSGQGRLLVEEARTNLLTRSEAFSNSVWVRNNVSVTANAIVSPDGTLTADKLVETSTTNIHTLNQPLPSSSGTYTFSVFIKASEKNNVRVDISDGATAAVGGVFNLSTGTSSLVTGGSWTNISTSSVQYPNGWWKCVVTATQGGGTVVNPRINLLDANGIPNYLGDGTSGIYIWGAQLEQGSTPSSYIPTEASAVTRAADNVSRVLGDEFNANEFSVYCDFSVGSGFFPAAFHFGDGTSSNRIILHRPEINSTLNTSFVLRVVVVGVTQTLVIPSSAKKAVITYKAGIYKAYANGVLIGSLSAALPPISVNTIGKGHSSEYCNGTIMDYKVFPKVLSDQECQELTKI